MREGRNQTSNGAEVQPSGFECVEDQGGTAWIRHDLEQTLIEAGLLREGGLTRALPVRDEYQGRGSTAIVDVADTSLVVRRFLPGGLLRRLRSPVFARPSRPFRELELLESLRRSDISTLEPVAAVARRVPGGYALELVTLQLRGACDLLGFALGSRERGRRSRRVVWRRAGVTLARVHAVGLDHADLHLKNFLESDGEVYIIDLDRSRLCTRLRPAQRHRNLARLWRYVYRQGQLRGTPLIDLRDVLSFLGGYEPDRRARHACFRKVRRRFERTRPLHAIGWMIDRLLHGAPDVSAPAERSDVNVSLPS